MWTKKSQFWHIVLFLTYPVIYLLLNSYIFIYRLDVASFSVFDIAVLIFAIFRLTRLFVYDWITDFLREFFSEWKSWFSASISELLACPWCMWIWISLLVLVMRSFPVVFMNLLYILALAWIVSFIQLFYKLISMIWDNFKK